MARQHLIQGDDPRTGARPSHIADIMLGRNGRGGKGTGRRRYLYDLKRTARIQRQRAARSLSGGEGSVGGK